MHPGPGGWAQMQACTGTARSAAAAMEGGAVQAVWAQRISPPTVPRTARILVPAWSRLLLVAALLCSELRGALASTCAFNSVSGWTATAGNPVTEALRVKVGRAPSYAGGHYMIQRMGQTDPHKAPNGFLKGRWDLPLMCAVLFETLKRNPASVCNATLATGSNSPWGAKATVDCTGVTPAYVVLSLCSSTCMLDKTRSCCKVPAQFAGTWAPRPLPDPRAQARALLSVLCIIVMARVPPAVCACRR